MHFRMLRLSENTLTYNFMKFNKSLHKKKHPIQIFFFCSSCTIWMQMNNHSLEKQNNWIKIKEHVKIFMKEERPTSHLLHTCIMLKMLLHFFHAYMLNLKTMTWAILNHCLLTDWLVFFHQHKVVKGLINNSFNSAVIPAESYLAF